MIYWLCWSVTCQESQQQYWGHQIPCVVVLVAQASRHGCHEMHGCAVYNELAS